MCESLLAEGINSSIKFIGEHLNTNNLCEMVS